MLWLLAVKKKKRLHLLQHQLLHQHLHLPQLLLLKPLLLLQAVPPLLLPAQLLPPPVLWTPPKMRWALPKTLLALPKTPLVLLATQPKKLLMPPKTQCLRSNFPGLTKNRCEAVFLRLSFYSPVHEQPSAAVAIVMSVLRPSTWPRQVRTSSGRLFS